MQATFGRFLLSIWLFEYFTIIPALSFTSIIMVSVLSMIEKD